MRRNEGSASHPSVGMKPVTPTVPWRVTVVRPLAGFRLAVEFADGTTGEVRMASWLASSSVGGSLFESLLDERAFRGVALEHGAVTWPNGADLAPDAMYDAIRADGFWEVD